MCVLLLYISFIIKCVWEWVSGIWGPLLNMIKVKGDKFLGTDKNGNKWQIFRDGGSNKYSCLNNQKDLTLNANMSYLN